MVKNMMKTLSEIDDYACGILQNMLHEGFTVEEAENVINCMRDIVDTAWCIGKEKVPLGTVLHLKECPALLKAKD
jgi:hypothetical protein